MGKSAPKEEIAACVVICQLPKDIASQCRQLDPLLKKCARYNWNNIDKTYNLDPNHIVVRCQNITVCTDVSAPSVAYTFDVPASKAAGLTSVTNNSWWELMDVVRDMGIEGFLNH